MVQRGTKIAIVVTALAALALVAFLVTKNFERIRGLVGTSVRGLKNITKKIGRGAVSGTDIVRNKVATTVREATSSLIPNSRLANDAKQVDVIRTVTANQTRSAEKAIASTIADEAKTVAGRAKDIVAIAVDNAKQIEIDRQRRASEEYASIIKKIEEERLKTGVILAGIDVERKKANKFIDREDDRTKNVLGMDGAHHDDNEGLGAGPFPPATVVEPVWTKAAESILVGELYRQQ